MSAGEGSHDPLERYNADCINHRPDEPWNCDACRDLPEWPPTAASYGSQLKHFDQALGAPSTPRRSQLRLLFLFLDPRPSESNFRAVGPLDSARGLDPPRHRYFCLTNHAWNALRLDEKVDRSPRWPTADDAHEYLRRYLFGGSWSYDGFLAYFMYLFDVADAYVTNLAKCYLGQNEESYTRCASRHLGQELALFRPDLVISFSSKIQSRRTLSKLVGCQPSDVPQTVYLYHPAAYRHHNRDRKFKEALRTSNDILSKRGIDTAQDLETWSSHCARLGYDTP